MGRGDKCLPLRPKFAGQKGHGYGRVLLEPPAAGGAAAALALLLPS